MNILNKLYTGSASQAIQDIAMHREKSGHCVVHFLYFANVVHHDILSTKAQVQNTKQTCSLQPEACSYYNALLTSDFLLPDGIALQTFYATAALIGRVSSHRKRLANCNGTDLTMPLLQYIHKTMPGLVVHLYGATQSVVTRAQTYIADQGITTGIVQNGYSNRDWGAAKDYTGPQILLVGRGTPLQEQRVVDNQSQIKKHKMLVLTVGGLFDFWSGEEKRTPPLFRGRAEWLWRLCVNPRKNAHKVRYSLHLPYYILRYLLLKR